MNRRLLLPGLLLATLVWSDDARPPLDRPPESGLPDDPIGESQPPPPPPPVEPPQLFVPSEQISADSAVAFPVDI